MLGHCSDHHGSAAIIMKYILYALIVICRFYMTIKFIITHSLTWSSASSIVINLLGNVTLL